MTPTLEGFLQFIRDAAGIPVIALPDDDIQIGYAYENSLELTSHELMLVGPTMYMLAVYNLGVSNLINWANDQPGQTYFADLRTSFGCGSFVAGVISSSADVSTSESLLVPDFMKNLTLANLQQLKDPFGRQWLAFQQRIGTIWGLS